MSSNKSQVESGALTEPLWDVATVPYPYPNNGVFIREYTIKLLSTSFPNMTAAEVLANTYLIVQIHIQCVTSKLSPYWVLSGDTICKWAF